MIIQISTHKSKGKKRFLLKLRPFLKLYLSDVRPVHVFTHGLRTHECLFHLLVQKYFDHAQTFLTVFIFFEHVQIFLTMVKSDILPYKFAYLSMVKNI